VTLTFDDVLSASTLGGKRGKSEGKIRQVASVRTSFCLTLCCKTINLKFFLGKPGGTEGLNEKEGSRQTVKCGILTNPLGQI